jgi:type II secretory ATPase GspE/PulE/Tfp pilus assembly ATPase PilB-like protein
MSDGFPSINDLLKKRAEKVGASDLPSAPSTAEVPPATLPTPASTPAPAPIPQKNPNGITFADEETSDKLSEKMSTIKKREKEDEAGRLAAAIGIQSINLKGFPISPEALSLLPEDEAKELQTVIFLFNGPEMRLGTRDPENPKVKELVFELEERHKTHAVLYLISEESFNQALKLYAALPKIKTIIKGVQITEAELEKYAAQMKDMTSIAAVLEHATVTEVLAVVIAASLKLASSDIHIEAEESGIIVRFRVDGILQEVAKLKSEDWKRLISRIKLIASLKINVTDQAQDGRFTIFQKNKKIDVRLSTIPTAFGESVVMRLLNPDTIALDFEKLGFRPAALKKIIKEVERPNGMIVTTGPTGSGKTTTLYAILQRLNNHETKIITLEDPIEYKVEGLNQSQIESSKEYTFAKGLRSILRQDPDIIMVGEIRDLETAEISIQAALTGHLLLSTIHTNDAAGAVPRFLSMGVAPHLLAPAINAIMGQRLVRKLCQACKKPVTLTPELMAEVKKQLDGISEASGEAKIDLEKVQFYGPAGCTECNNTGYKGRIGLYEVLIKDAEIEKAILGGNISEYDMREVAKRQGMVTMAEDGLLKASEGLTSVEEVKRIVGL